MLCRLFRGWRNVYRKKQDLMLLYSVLLSCCTYCACWVCLMNVTMMKISSLFTPLPLHSMNYSFGSPSCCTTSPFSFQELMTRKQLATMPLVPLSCSLLPLWRLLLEFGMIRIYSKNKWRVVTEDLKRNTNWLKTFPAMEPTRCIYSSMLVSTGAPCFVAYSVLQTKYNITSNIITTIITTKLAGNAAK